MATNSVEVDSKEKYLIVMISRDHLQFLSLTCNQLQEFSDELEVLDSKEKMEQCDLICLLYDVSNPASFAHIASLQRQISESYDVPTCYFATKTDLPLAAQVFLSVLFVTDPNRR